MLLLHHRWLVGRLSHRLHHRVRAPPPSLHGNSTLQRKNEERNRSLIPRCVRAPASTAWLTRYSCAVLERRYYTSHSYTPVRDVARSTETGAATNIIYGLALGYQAPAPAPSLSNLHAQLLSPDHGL